MSDTGVFTVGGTVPYDSQLYISRAADRQLLGLCRAGAFAYVLTARQMGKSSLVVRTASRLSEVGVSSAIVDFNRIGIELTAEQWYLGILVDINDQLPLDEDVISWWQANAHLGYSQRLTVFFRDLLLPQLDGPVVVFVDEIDTTLSLNFTDDLFAAIRFMYDARAREPVFQQLSFVLVGVASPGDLIQDPRRTPFNIGQRVDLDDFTAEEAQPFADGLQQPLIEARQVLEWILKWTHGHPYLTQQLCRAVVEADQDAQAGIQVSYPDDLLQHLLFGKTSWSEAELDGLVENLLLGEQSEKNNNLLFVRDMLTKGCPDRYKYEVLFVYRQIRRGRHPVVDEAQSIAKSHLKLSGIVRSERGVLRMRNRIYARVFDEHWATTHLPVNWPKRLQRLAISTIAVLFVMSIVLAILFGLQLNNAEAATKRTEALLLAVLSQQESDREQAVKLAVAAAKGYQSDQEDEEVVIGPFLQETLLRYTQDKTTSLPIAEHTTSVALNPDGTLVVTTNAADVVHVSNIRTGAIVANLGKIKGVTSVVFSPDGLRLAAASHDGAVHLWNVNSKGIQASSIKFSGAGDLTSLVFSPDSRRMAAISSDGTIHVWSVSDGANLANLPGADNIASIAFAPDPNQMLTVSSDGTLLTWDISTGVSTKSKDVGDATSAALSPDGSWIVIVDNEKVYVRDTATGQDVIKPQPRGDSTKFAFSPTGKQIIAVGSGSVAQIYDCELCTSLQNLLVVAKHYVPKELTEEEREQALNQIRKATQAPPSATTEPSHTPTTTDTPVPSSTPASAPATEVAPVEAYTPDIPALRLTDTPTDTPEPSPTDTPEPSPTDTPEQSPTDTPEQSPTDTPEPSPTDTPEPSPTDTPEPSPTDTLEPTPTDTLEPTPTDTLEPTPTDTPIQNG